jgi:hypothetical protein
MTAPFLLDEMSEKSACLLGRSTYVALYTSRYHTARANHAITFEAIGVQVLVIDEIHNILAGSPREQRIVLNALRFLSNELKMSLICFGVTDAREAIGGDVQLARRFDELTLPRWSADAQYEALIVSILRNISLREPTVLIAKSLRRILQVTEGLTALIFRMLNELAIEAAMTGVERITDEAVERWKPSSETEAVFS